MYLLKKMIYSSQSRNSKPRYKQTFFLISDSFRSNCFIILWLSIRYLFATLFHWFIVSLIIWLFHWSTNWGPGVILLWEIKTTNVKRFYYSYLWMLRGKKMVYFIKPLFTSTTERRYCVTICDRIAKWWRCAYFFP